ncbi:MAG: long-chain-fatty-acid--CoA ligase [Ramlibacter sp.]|nr:long-chain-fatty-acid--CoA ligase [Ramlibacter sp.]
MTTPADPHAHRRAWPPGVPLQFDPGERTLWEGFAARAAAEPDAIGLDFLGRGYSWRELVQSAERLAGALQALGVAPGDRVLLFSQNCPQFVFGLHAAVRCGAVAVPLNPMNKAGELSHYIADAGAKVALAAGDIAAELARASDSLGPEGLAHLVVFQLADALPQEGGGAAHWPPAWQSWLQARHPLPRLAHGQVHDESALVAQAPAPRPLSARAGDLVLLPYTSGTTGLPKGCCHTHATLLHNALASGGWMDQRPGDVALVVVPMFHITGLVMGLLAAIHLHCKLVLLPRWDRQQAARAIARQRVTHWANIPTMVIDLLAAPDVDRQALASLRYIGGGGAAMPEAVATRLHEEFGLTYVEGYGLTETAAPTHINPRHAARRQCLGIPYVGTEARVVDPDTLRPLPAGEVGEIVVSGPQVFRGYWRQPEATAAAFIELDGRRFLRTGDLGRVDPDGYYHLADRLKRMINASGFKVWPAEVEALLPHHPGVQEACVIARRHPYRGETVKAVVVPRQGLAEPLTEQALVEWARGQMAAFKYPREIEFAQALPRSASGKVMWRELQARQDELDAAPRASASIPQPQKKETP